MKRTISRPVTVEGIGIHIGEPAVVTLQPAESGGIRFHLHAESGTQEIAARSANVVEATRCTVLGSNGHTIATVEHLLSTLVGLGITDMIVEVTGRELPIGDGSATFWMEALQQAQPYPIIEETPIAALKEPVICTGKNGAIVAGYPSQSLHLTVVIHFDHAMVGTQIARFAPSQNGEAAEYATEVAPARTFGFLEEIEALRSAGLARGGTLENAIVVYPDHFSVPLRFENELSRHKLLDLMGDLSLAVGTLPVGDYIAVKPSHRLNTEFAARLAQSL